MEGTVPLGCLRPPPKSQAHPLAPPAGDEPSGGRGKGVEMGLAFLLGVALLGPHPPRFWLFS